MFKLLKANVDEMTWNDCKHNEFSKLTVIWLQWIQYKPLHCIPESLQRYCCTWIETNEPSNSYAP